MDPMSYNLYAYCKNNPVAYVDPSGNLRICSRKVETSANGGFNIPEDDPNMEHGAIYQYAEYIANDPTSDSPSYINYNVSAGEILVITTGILQDADNNLHPYIGVGLGFGLPVTGSVTISPNDTVSHGPNINVAVEPIVSYDIGTSLPPSNDNNYEEYGAALPGISLTPYYVF